MGESRRPWTGGWGRGGGGLALAALLGAAGCYADHGALDGGALGDGEVADAAPGDAGPLGPPSARACAPGEPCDCRAVRAIPAGTHWQGFTAFAGGPNTTALYHPGHRVQLTRDHWLGTYEATAGCYHWCRWEGGCREPRWTLPPPYGFGAIHQGLPLDYWRDPARADLPIVDLTLAAAREYCAWLGGRLPTDVEWEKAARGERGRALPWAPDPAVPPSEADGLGEFGSPCGHFHSPFFQRIHGCDPVPGFVVAVDSLPSGVGPYGHFHLYGNASEWVEDSAVQYGVEPGALRVDPEPARVPGALALTRGAMPGWAWTRYAVHSVPELEWDAYGVRCAFDERPSPLIFGED